MKASALTIFEFDLRRRSVDRSYKREGKKSKYTIHSKNLVIFSNQV